MLSCFNLGKETSIDVFQTALADFSEYMQKRNLVCTVGPLGRRCSDTPMDTDEDRALEYYFIMSFRDRAQCDDAYAFIENDSASHATHINVIAKVKDAVFVCWEDIDA